MQREEAGGRGAGGRDSGGSESGGVSCRWALRWPLRIEA